MTPRVSTKTDRLYLEAMFKKALEESVAAGNAVRYVDASGQTVYRATRKGRESIREARKAAAS